MSGTTYNDNNTIIQNILSVHTDGKHVSTYLLNLASYLSESDTMFIIPDVGIYIPTAWKTDIENFISSESYQIYQAALTPTAGRTVEDAITINTVRLMPSYINTAGRVISSVFTLNSNDPINVNDKIFAQIYNNDKKTLRVMYEYSAAERSNDATKNVPLIAKNTELETIFATAKLLGQEYFNAFGTLMIEYMLQYDDISVIFSLAEYFPEIEEIIAAYYNNKFPGHEIYNYAYDLIQSGNSNFLVDNIVTQIMSSYPLDNTKYISQKDILKLVDYINQSFHAKYNTDFSKYDAVNQASIDTLYAKYSKMVGVLSKNYGIQLSGAFIDDKKRIKLTMKLPIINKDNQKISAINGVSIVKLITNNNSVEHSVEFSVSNLNDELKTKINKAFNGLLLVVGFVSKRLS